MLRNGFYALIATLVESLIGFIYAILVARTLGASDYGMWTYGIASYGLAMGIVAFGFDFLIAQRVGAGRVDDASFIGMTLITRLALLGLAGAGLGIYASLSEPASDTRTLLLILAPALIGKGTAQWARACFLAYERLGVYVPVSIALRSLEAFVGFALLSGGAGLVQIATLHTLFAVVEALIGVSMVRLLVTQFTFNVRMEEIGDFLCAGALPGLGSAMGMWLALGPIALLHHLSFDMTIIGQVGFVLNVMMILVAAGQGFLSAAIPALSRALSHGDTSVIRYARTTAVTSLGLAAIASILGGALGPRLTEFALGSNFQLVGVLLGPSLAIAGLITAPTAYAQLLLATGHRWPGILASGFACLTLPALMPFTVAVWGGQGALAAIAASWAARIVILATIIKWQGIALASPHRNL